MNERSLTRICLAGSVSGIIIIYLISFMIVPEEIRPGEITQEHLGRRIKTEGTVQELRTHPDGHIFFELADETGSANIVIWEDRAEQLTLSGVNLSMIKNGIGIEITGDLEYYRGNLQIVV